MKVAKAHSNEHGQKVVNHFVYYVDQDWNLAIGYISYARFGCGNATPAVQRRILVPRRSGRS